MKPTAELSREHQAILLMIRILERMSDRLEAGENVDLTHLEKAVDFIKVFADKCHHGKEEDLLFPAMEKAGIPKTGGPLGVMLHEHVEGRGFVKAMSYSLPAIRKGDRAAAARFAESAGTTAPCSPSTSSRKTMSSIPWPTPACLRPSRAISRPVSPRSRIRSSAPASTRNTTGSSKSSNPPTWPEPRFPVLPWVPPAARF